MSKHDVGFLMLIALVCPFVAMGAYTMWQIKPVFAVLFLGGSLWVAVAFWLMGND